MIFGVEMPANFITSHSKFQLNHAKRFQDVKVDRVSFFFLFFLSRCESCHKTQKHYPIALKFGTLKGGAS